MRAVELTELKKVEEKFKLGIRVYEPSKDGTWRLIRQPAHYEAIGIEPMTIGWYGDHAFLIKDIKKVANIYAYAHCNQQFTQVCSLQRHADRCTKGETQVCCPGQLVERPQSAYEKAFYPMSNASKGSIDWLEYEAEKRNLHIHHARCGHGGALDCWRPCGWLRANKRRCFNIMAVTITAVLPTASKIMPVSCYGKHSSKS